MKCPYCHTEIEDGKRICPACEKYITKEALEAQAAEEAALAAQLKEAESEELPSEPVEEIVAETVEPAEEVLEAAPSEEIFEEEFKEENAETAPVAEGPAAQEAQVADEPCTAVAEPAPEANIMLPVPPDPKPEKGSQWATIGTWGWIGISLLMLVPVLNLVLLLVWSFGGAKKTVKQSWARAMLVLVLAGMILMLGLMLWLLLSPERSAWIFSMFRK